MILSQAVTIANNLLAHGNVNSLTIERKREPPRFDDEKEEDRFLVAVNDPQLDADDLARILKYEGAVRTGRVDLGPPRGLTVKYVAARFLIEDE